MKAKYKFGEIVRLTGSFGSLKHYMNINEVEKVSYKDGEIISSLTIDNITNYRINVRADDKIYKILVPESVILGYPPKFEIGDTVTMNASLLSRINRLGKGIITSGKITHIDYRVFPEGVEYLYRINNNPETISERDLIYVPSPTHPNILESTEYLRGLSEVIKYITSQEKTQANTESLKIKKVKPQLNFL